VSVRFSSVDDQHPFFNSSTFHIDVPLKTRRNGTLYMYAVIALDDGSLDWKEFQRDGPTVIQRVALTSFMVPKDELFNLLQDEKRTEKKKKPAVGVKTRTHIKTKVFITMLTDKASLSPQDIQNAPELARMTRMSRKNEFLPMVSCGFLVLWKKIIFLSWFKLGSCLFVVVRVGSSFVHVGL
jgi:hypothetical protein